MFPIFIPSHNRPLSCKFCYDCKELELPFKIFIDKNQLEAYSKNFKKKNIEVVPNYITNLVETRQYILDYARKEGYDWFFMIDDDIQKIKYRKKKGELILLKYVDFFNKMYDTVREIDNELPNHKLGQIGFKNSPFALQDKPISINTEIASIILFNVKNTLETNYWNTIACEDVSYNLQLLIGKKNTMKFNHIVFFTPKSGTSKGGLEEYYANGGKQEGINKVKEIYEEFITTYKEGKYRIKWVKFKDPILEETYSNAIQIVFE